jgi:hypothetical protein
MIDTTPFESFALSKEKLNIFMGENVRKSLILRINMFDSAAISCVSCQQEIAYMNFYGSSENADVICCTNCMDGIPPLLEAWRVVIIFDEEPTDMRLIVGSRQELSDYMNHLLDKCPDCTYDIIARHISDGWVPDERLAVIAELSNQIADATLVQLDPWLSELAERIKRLAADSSENIELDRAQILKGLKG